MFKAEAIEFPFTASLPKREKSRLARSWDVLKRMAEISETDGMLLPLMFAAKCLNLSRTRMDQLIVDGRLKRHDIDGHVFITQNSIEEFAAMERKNGRPMKVLSLGGQVGGAFKAGVKIGVSLSEKKS